MGRRHRMVQRRNGRVLQTILCFLRKPLKQAISLSPQTVQQIDPDTASLGIATRQRFNLGVHVYGTRYDQVSHLGLPYALHWEARATFQSLKRRTLPITPSHAPFFKARPRTRAGLVGGGIITPLSSVKPKRL